MRGSATSRAGVGSSGSCVAKALRHHLVVAPAVSGRRGTSRQFTLAPPIHSEVKPPCEWPATPMRLGSITGPQVASPRRKLMASLEVDRALPQSIGEISDVRVIRVGAIVIDRRHDVTALGEVLAEPGIKQRIAAAPMREHDQRMRAFSQVWGGVAGEVQTDEERHHPGRAAIVFLGRIVQPTATIADRHR